MCHQAVGLIQAVIERQGIPTASITLLPEVTRAVQPPRALSVPFPLGYPLGAPDDPPLQRGLLRALLALVAEDDVPVLHALGPPQDSSRDQRP
jgi:hypothetical protein